MNITIIPTTEDRIPDFWPVLDEVCRERLYMAFLQAPALEKVREFVMGNIKQGAPQFLALDDDKVVGWCDISLSNRDTFLHVGSLGMGILKSHRGQGVGKALMTAALDKAKSIGLTRVELTVREHNLTAMHLYKQFGFVVEGIKRNGVRIDNIYEDLICMGMLFE